MVLLVDEPESAPFGRDAGHVSAVQQDPARSHAGVAGDRLEQRGFPRARRSDDERVAAARHRERHVAEVEAADLDRDAIELDHVRSEGWRSRTNAKTASATSSSNTAAGTAADSPNAVNRSKIRTLATLGL